MQATPLLSLKTAPSIAMKSARLSTLFLLPMLLAATPAQAQISLQSAYAVQQPGDEFRGGSPYVDISFDAISPTVLLKVDISVTSEPASIMLPTTSSLSGDWGAGVLAGLGKQIIWDAGADRPNVLWPETRVRVRAEELFDAVAVFPSPTTGTWKLFGPPGFPYDGVRHKDKQVFLNAPPGTYTLVCDPLQRYATPSTETLVLDPGESLAFQPAWNWGPPDPISLVFVPAGDFLMGPADGEQGETDEDPQHQVTLSAYRIGQYEVTNAQFCDVLNWALARGYPESVSGAAYNGGYVYFNGEKLLEIGNANCQITYSDNPKGFRPIERDGRPMNDYPVVMVTWYGAVAFSNWLSKQQGLVPAYDLATWSLIDADTNQADMQFLEGYRLPTEAEWERAAAWDGAYHWRYGYSSDVAEEIRMNINMSNPLGGSVPYLTPVGYFNGENGTVESFSPTGCYDMSGNVSEWCHDYYDSAYYGKENIPDPIGPLTGSIRVVRGGHYQYSNSSCRAAKRDNGFLSPGGFLGFRVARSDSSSGGGAALKKFNAPSLAANKKRPPEIDTLYSLPFTLDTRSSNTRVLTIIIDGAGTVQVEPLLDPPNYVIGSTIILTATPAQGYEFARWSGEITSTSNPVSFSMPDHDTTVTAHFEPVTGALIVDPTPDHAPWTLTNGLGEITTGTGYQLLLQVPTGDITLVWGAIPDYDLPVETTVTLQLSKGDIIPIPGDYIIHPPEPPFFPDPRDGEREVGIARRLTWTPGRLASNYDIYLWPTAGSEPAHPTASFPFMPHYDPPTDLDAGTNYSWRVVSKNATDIAPGATWEFSTVAPPATPPPASVLASDGAFADKVRVTWNYETGPAYFRVYRSEALEGEKLKLGVWQPETTYDDTTVTASTPYYYWVRAAANENGDLASEFLAYDTGWTHSVNDLKTFKITYKNTVIEVDGDGSIRGRAFQNRAVGANARGNKSTVKITELKETPPDSQDMPGVKYILAASVPQVSIKGDVSKLYSEAPMRILEIEGKVKRLTFKKTHAEMLLVGEVGTLKMSGAGRSYSGPENLALRGNGRQTRDAAESNHYTTNVASGVIHLVDFSSFRRVRHLFKGVILREYSAPNQKIDEILVQTKKERNSLNLGGLEGGPITAKSISLLKTKGGPIAPTLIQCDFSTREMKIMATAGVFTSGTDAIHQVSPGAVSPVLIDVDVPSLVISAHGGNMKPKNVYVSGQIKLMTSNFKKVRGSEKPNFLGVDFNLDDRQEELKIDNFIVKKPIYFGGYLGMAERDENKNDILETTSKTLVVSGVGVGAPRVNVDILKIFGALGIRGNFMAAPQRDLEFLPPDPENTKIDIKGSIFKIQIKSSNTSEYPMPYILGAGWTNTPIQYKTDNIPHLDFTEYYYPRE